jgi:hypothetical protein
MTKIEGLLEAQIDALEKGKSRLKTKMQALEKTNIALKVKVQIVVIANSNVASIKTLEREKVVLKVHNEEYALCVKGHHEHLIVILGRPTIERN